MFKLYSLEFWKISLDGLDCGGGHDVFLTFLNAFEAYCRYLDIYSYSESAPQPQQKKQSSSDSYFENGFRTGLKVRSWLRPHPSDARLGLHLGLIGTNSLEELRIGWLSWRILSCAGMKQSQSSVNYCKTPKRHHLIPSVVTAKVGDLPRWSCACDTGQGGTSTSLARSTTGGTWRSPRTLAAWTEAWPWALWNGCLTIIYDHKWS